MAAEIITLDTFLRDARVLNSSYSSGRTVLQHEIVIWDPERILGRYATGSNYNNAASLTDHASAAFVLDLQRRSEEFKDFLALGRLLVVFTPAPFHWYYGTGEKRNDGTAAKPRMIRIVGQVDVNEVLPISVDLVRGQGEECKLVAGSPFSSFWRAAGEQFYFHSYFGKPVGQTLLVMAGTDRPVSALVEAHGGIVLMLPQLGEYEPDVDEIGVEEDDDEFDDKYEAARREIQSRYHGRFIDALVALHAELVRGSDDALPPWSEDYLLPGEPEAVAATIVAQQRLAEAQQALEEAQAELVGLQRQKLMVTGTGKSLEARVHEALTTLGCVVEEGEPGRTDRIVRWGDRVAVVEVKGLTKSAKESDAAQLEKWVSAYIEEHEIRPKAILAVGAWREVPLAERKHPAFPNQMLKYAVGREHCLVDTAQILSAVMTCRTKRAKEGFLKVLFETIGVLEGYDWKASFTHVESHEARP
jgi:hypothetical protein